MNAIVLAGGKSSRMGFDKAFIKVEGSSIINRQLKILKKICKKIIIVTNNPQKHRFKSVKLVKDIIPDCGPLGGIYSGLIASDSFYNFVVACDMPFIDSRLIKYMQKQASGCDIVIPKIGNRYEPLFCIYSKDCIKYIKELLDKKKFKISKLFSKAKVKEIKKNEILRFASPEKIFININTSQDLNKLCL